MSTRHPPSGWLNLSEENALAGEFSDGFAARFRGGTIQPPANPDKEELMQVEIGGYRPGAIGRVAEMHAEYYHCQAGFGLYFEAKVATELAAFLSRFTEGRDGFWTLRSGNRLEGAIAIDGLRAADEGAHLRWFIVSPALRGGGWGRRLMTEAVSFCDRQGYRRIGLWTFAGLDAARHLYESFGFRLVAQGEGEQWGARVVEQRFERDREAAAR